MKSKTKGLFLDVSEFSILAAKTSGYKLPITIEDLTEIPLKEGQDEDEVKSLLEEFVDFQGNDYFVSVCGVYPESRFTRYYEADTVNKAKDVNHLRKVLQEQFSIDPDKNVLSILDANDGSDYDMQKSLSKKLLFCGAKAEELQKIQNSLLSYAIYPEQMTIASISTLGGFCDYAKFKKMQSPLLCLEMTSSSANIFIQNRGKVEVTRPVSFGLDSIYPLLQKELGLKDETSARKLFYSNTFDFAEMGPKLMSRITKELQACTGFYEVQTGQTIDKILLSVLPKNLSWIEQTLSRALGLDVIKPDFELWLESLQIKLGESADLSGLSGRWFSVFSLMAQFHLRESEASNG
jgi:hypothetical protein